MASKYTFGEKTTEYMNGKELPVWQPPKYLATKKKVIETLESDKYKNVLNESDFWILMNTYAGGKKVMYSGLIISHNGCLKINDTLDENEKFNPNCVAWDKDGFSDSLVCMYTDADTFEVGEVSKMNCKNAYPYAMAFKRLFDRVVLKKSKLAYSGVYSDSEAEEFKKDTDKEDYTKELNIAKDVDELKRYNNLIIQALKRELDFKDGKHKELLLKFAKTTTVDCTKLTQDGLKVVNDTMDMLIAKKIAQDEKEQDEKGAIS